MRMAFWGVEVKPGKPITHSCENAWGRLRISQATLGIGEATGKTILQCNVGEKSPVLLCALLPNKTESCQLDLEFEEPDDVIFSVIGPRIVFLTGYYVQKIRPSNRQSDTESYGLDIENTHTEGSSYASDEEEDKYDDSFINDDDGAELRISPWPLEETAEDDEPKDKKGRHRKKHRVIETDSGDANSHEKGEDEDDFSLSAFKRNRTTTPTMSDDDGEKNQMGDRAKDDSVCGIEPKQKVDCLDTNGEAEGITKLPTDEVCAELPKETETVEEINVSGEKVIEQMQSLDVAKPEKKRKKRSKKETCNILTKDNMDICENSEDGQKSKKIRNELGMVTKLGEFCSEEIGSESRDIAKEDVSVQVLPHDDSVKEDLPAETGLYLDPLIDDITNTTNKEILASDSQSKKKTKKKKKTSVEKDLTIKSDNEETMSENVPFISRRTLPRGLIIEELSHGPPDGKTADLGKKVKIYYTAKVKVTGHVFESNVGETAYQFELGNEEIIDGWNIGINGMRVGDKRRLTIPPSLGFGDQGVGEDVPPNSWLVYEIELVGVRR